MNAPRVLMAGGGTAGHLFPCLAVAEELAELAPGSEVRYVGARGRIDQRVLAERGLPHDLIDARPVPYRPSLEAGRAALATVRAVGQAARIIRSFDPHVVFTTGGFVGAAVGLAARRVHRALVLHVPDARPDRGNRLVARWAAAITAVSERAVAALGKGVVTGHPVRRELAQATRAQGLTALGLDAARPIILVTGGSQGARRLNLAVLAALPVLLDELGAQVVHLSGSLDYATLRAEAERLGNPSAYHLHEQLTNPGLALAVADLAITRAGAGSLAEICLHGVPMIVVPYPFAGGHQRLNAEPLAEAGAAILVPDEEFTPERLGTLARELLSDSERRAHMSAAARAAARPDAARAVAQTVLAVAERAVS